MHLPTRDILCIIPASTIFLMKNLVGVLKSSVTVEDWMCVRIQMNCFIKSGKHKIVVVTVANFVSYDTPVIKVENCAKIQLFHGHANIGK